MIALLLALTFKPWQISNPPLSQSVGQVSRKRIEYLPNGSVLFLENVPDSRNLVVHLDSSARGEQNATWTGARHLLEHLSVLGSSGRLDENLELNGAFLTASTKRDGLDIAIAARPDGLKLCLDALREITRPAVRANKPWWTEADLNREKKIIAQEIALENSPERLSDAAWTLAFGKAGASPLGQLSELKKVTIQEEIDLYRTSFQGNHICLDIEGPIDLRLARLAGEKFLSEFKNSSQRSKWVLRKPNLTQGKRITADAIGSARAVIAKGIFEPDCVAKIAAGLAFASTIHGGFFIYTPSVLNGIMTIGSRNPGEIEKSVDSYTTNELPGLYSLGKELAIRFIHFESDPARPSAYWRSYLLAQNPAARPKVLLNLIQTMSVSDFVRAAKCYQASEAIEVQGNQ